MTEEGESEKGKRWRVRESRRSGSEEREEWE